MGWGLSAGGGCPAQALLAGAAPPEDKAAPQALRAATGVGSQLSSLRRLRSGLRGLCPRSPPTHRLWEGLGKTWIQIQWPWGAFLPGPRKLPGLFGGGPWDLRCPGPENSASPEVGGASPWWASSMHPWDKDPNPECAPCAVSSPPWCQSPEGAAWGVACSHLTVHLVFCSGRAWLPRTPGE